MNPHEARLQRLQQSGNKITNARMVVLEALEGMGGHPTSSEVLEHVETLDDSVGRASVFRTLDLYTQLGIIRPIYHAGGAARYVLMPEGHHHHIVCLNCNKTIDFEDCGLDELQRQLQERYRIQLTGHLLEFYGLCESCLN